MQYWLGANERTHVLPTDKWYLDFATSILPLVKTSPLFNKEDPVSYTHLTLPTSDLV